MLQELFGEDKLNDIIRYCPHCDYYDDIARYLNFGRFDQKYMSIISQIFTFKEIVHLKKFDEEELEMYNQNRKEFKYHVFNNNSNRIKYEKILMPAFHDFNWHELLNIFSDDNNMGETLKNFIVIIESFYGNTNTYIALIKSILLIFMKFIYVESTNKNYFIIKDPYVFLCAGICYSDDIFMLTSNLNRLARYEVKFDYYEHLIYQRKINVHSGRRDSKAKLIAEDFLRNYPCFEDFFYEIENLDNNEVIYLSLGIDKDLNEIRQGFPGFLTSEYFSLNDNKLFMMKLYHFAKHQEDSENAIAGFFNSLRDCYEKNEDNIEEWNIICNEGKIQHMIMGVLQSRYRLEDGTFVNLENIESDKEVKNQIDNIDVIIEILKTFVLSYINEDPNQSLNDFLKAVFGFLYSKKEDGVFINTKKFIMVLFTLSIYNEVIEHSPENSVIGLKFGIDNLVHKNMIN